MHQVDAHGLLHQLAVDVANRSRSARSKIQPAQFARLRLQIRQRLDGHAGVAITTSGAEPR